MVLFQSILPVVFPSQCPSRMFQEERNIFLPVLNLHMIEDVLLVSKQFYLFPILSETISRPEQDDKTNGKADKSSGSCVQQYFVEDASSACSIQKGSFQI